MPDTFVPAANTASVELIFSYNGVKCENVYHVLGQTAFDATSLNDLAGRFVAWYASVVNIHQPTQVILEQVIAKALDSNIAPAIEFGVGLPMPGTYASGIPLPNSVTVAVKWSTAFRGRSYRGRTYHIGLTEDMVNGNQLGSADRLVVLGYYQALLEEFSEPDARLVVLSRYENNAPRVAALTTQITGVSLDDTIDTQRRRLPKWGR